METALLDLLKEESELVSRIRKIEYETAFHEKRAEERKDGPTICDKQAALDDFRKARQLLEEEVRLLGRLKENRVKIRNYLKEVLLK